MAIRVHREKCTGCGICVDSCPFESIEMIDDIAAIDETCTLCGACVEVCEFEALEMEEVEAAHIHDVSVYRGVWVFAEQRHGNLSSVTHELLGEGRKLADQLDTPLSAVLLGHDISSEAPGLISYGADNVLVVDDPALKDFHNERYVAVLSDLIRKEKPEIVLCGATAIGRSFIPKVAARLGTGLTADCTGLDVDLKKRLLLQTRPAFGGNILATILCPNHRPQMSTVRHKVFKKAGRDETRQGEIFKRDLNGISMDLKSKVIGRLATKGNFNVYDNPLVKNMGNYIYKAYIDYPYFINFADADATTGSRPQIIYTYGKDIQDPIMEKFSISG